MPELKRRTIGFIFNAKKEVIGVTITKAYDMPKLSDDEVEYFRNHPKFFFGDVEVKD